MDGLRGLAVLMVYIFHYGGGLRSPHAFVRFFGHLTEAGWTGVTLFFALSGFLITGSLWDSRRQKNILRNFYARRGLRILPLYFGTLLIAWIIAVGRGSTFADTKSFLIYVFFLQDLPVFSQIQMIASPLPLYHLWSLAVEEQFYLAWPFLVLHCHSPRSALRLAVGTFTLSTLFIWLVYGVSPIARATAQSFDQFALTHAGALGLGAALAIASRDGLWPRVQRHAPLALGVAVAVFAVSGFFAGSYALVSRLQFALGLPAASVAVAAMVALALRPGGFRAFLSLPGLPALGRISYGFYVFHILLQPVFDFLATRLTHHTAGFAYQGARFVVAFPISVAVALLSYLVLELPFLHSKRRYPMHRALRTPTPTPTPR